MSFEEMGPVVNFLRSFLHCLSPVPWDRDIDSLVNRAHSVMVESLMTIMTNEMAFMAQNPERSTRGVNAINEVSCLIGKWKDLHQESEQARLQRFHRRYLVHDANPDANKEMSKSNLKRNKKIVRPQPISFREKCVPIATCSKRRSMRDSSNADSVG
jgi:hypothetical protein